jgi:hypothetical protein
MQPMPSRSRVPVVVVVVVVAQLHPQHRALLALCLPP